MYRTPILFNIFNRPDCTKLVFQKIREIRPQKLFVHADGPRMEKVGELEKCEMCQRIIKEGVDWNCELHLLFRNENLGCGKGPASAITCFFENVEQGIILEDDCVPHEDFFRFAELMLDKYRSDERVCSIAGSNFQDGHRRGDASYYFSNHNRIWGWATWRRTWQNYDYFLERYSDEEIDNVIDSKFFRKRENEYWKRVMHGVKQNRINDSCWDFQFMFMQWAMNGLTLTPNVNLISNIGDGDDATHTNWKGNANMRRKVESMQEIKETECVMVDERADEYYMNHYIIVKNPLWKRVINKILKIIGKK